MLWRNAVGKVAAAVAMLAGGGAPLAGCRKHDAHAQTSSSAVPRPDTIGPTDTLVPRVVGTDGAGTRYVLLGPLRAEIPARGEIALAPESVERGIAAAVPVAHGWVFEAGDGAVAWAPTFLGTLHRLGRAPCASSWASARRGRGRWVVLDGAQAWATDGASPVAPLPASSVLGAARRVAFVAADFGAAVLGDGSVRYTVDGGASWRAVAVGGEPAWEVRADEPTAPAPALVVLTTERAWTIARDGTAAPRAAPPAPARLAHDVVSALREAARRWRVTAFRVAGPRRPRQCPEPVARGVGAEGGEGGFPFDSYVCFEQGRAGAPAALPPYAARGWASFRQDEGDGHGAGALRVHAHPAEHGTWSMRAAWTGEDARGPFGGRAEGPAPWRAPFAGVTPPDPSAPSDSDAAESAGLVRLQLATRAGALLEGEVFEGPVWARAGGGLAPLVRDVLPGVPLAHADRAFTVRAAVEQPDGGALVLLAAAADRGDDDDDDDGTVHEEQLALREALRLEEFRVLVDLGPDGVVRARRAFRFADAPSFIAPARAGGRAGLAVRDDTTRPASLLFHPLVAGAAPERVLGAFPDAPLDACRGAPPADALVEVYVDPSGGLFLAAGDPSLPVQDDDLGPLASPTRATVAIDRRSGRACLREVQGTYRSYEDNTTGAVRLVPGPRPTLLVGVRAGGRARRAVRCDSAIRNVPDV